MVDSLADDVRRLRQSFDGLPPPQVEPPLVLVCGLPGTGKSFFCRRLAKRYPFLILASDVLRKILFPCPKYDEEENRRLFPACHVLIGELLGKGIPVIFDATNLLERHREHLYHVAGKSKARLVLVRVEAPQELVRQRLLARKRRLAPQDNSQAGWEVYEKMKARKEKIPRNHFVVDTSQDVNGTIDKIVRAIRR